MRNRMRQSWCFLCSETGQPTKAAVAQVARFVACTETSPADWILRNPRFGLPSRPYIVAPLYRVIDPVSTPMVWRWATGARVQRAFVPLRRIAPALPITVIMAEDGAFCRNPGIDLAAIREVLEQSDDDVEDSRGASTITQQMAKNLFLWSGHSIVRKVLEIPLALWLNVVLPKRRIMEIYLNIAEWGPNGEFGVEAGSRWAFGKPARDLNPNQAAELTAILPNPSARSARHPGAGVLATRRALWQRAATYPTHDACLRAH